MTGTQIGHATLTADCVAEEQQQQKHPVGHAHSMQLAQRDTGSKVQDHAGKMDAFQSSTGSAAAIESSRLTIHARVELLKSMKTALAKQAAEAVKSISALAAPGSLANVKRKGAATVKASVPDSTTAQTGTEPTAVSETGDAAPLAPSVMAASQTVALYSALLNGTAEILPGTWLPHGRPCLFKPLSSNQLNNAKNLPSPPPIMCAGELSADMDHWLEESIRRSPNTDVATWTETPGTAALAAAAEGSQERVGDLVGSGRAVAGSRQVLGGPLAAEGMLWVAEEEAEEELELALEVVELPSYLQQRCGQEQQLQQQQQQEQQKQHLLRKDQQLSDKQQRHCSDQQGNGCAGQRGGMGEPHQERTKQQQQPEPHLNDVLAEQQCQDAEQQQGQRRPSPYQPAATAQPAVASVADVMMSAGDAADTTRPQPLHDATAASQPAASRWQRLAPGDGRQGEGRYCPSRMYPTMGGGQRAASWPVDTGDAADDEGGVAVVGDDDCEGGATALVHGGDSDWGDGGITFTGMSDGTPQRAGSMGMGKGTTHLHRQAVADGVVMGAQPGLEVEATGWGCELLLRQQVDATATWGAPATVNIHAKLNTQAPAPQPTAVGACAQSPTQDASLRASAHQHGTVQPAEIGAPAGLSNVPAAAIPVTTAPACAAVHPPVPQAPFVPRFKRRMAKYSSLQASAPAPGGDDQAAEPGALLGVNQGAVSPGRRVGAGQAAGVCAVQQRNCVEEEEDVEADEVGEVMRKGGQGTTGATQIVPLQAASQGPGAGAVPARQLPAVPRFRRRPDPLQLQAGDVGQGLQDRCEPGIHRTGPPDQEGIEDADAEDAEGGDARGSQAAATQGAAGAPVSSQGQPQAGARMMPVLGRRRTAPTASQRLEAQRDGAVTGAVKGCGLGVGRPMGLPGGEAVEDCLSDGKDACGAEVADRIVSGDSSGGSDGEQPGLGSRGAGKGVGPRQGRALAVAPLGTLGANPAEGSVGPWQTLALPVSQLWSRGSSGFAAMVPELLAMTAPAPVTVVQLLPCLQPLATVSADTRPGMAGAGAIKSAGQAAPGAAPRPEPLPAASKARKLRYKPVHNPEQLLHKPAPLCVVQPGSFQAAAPGAVLGFKDSRGSDGKRDIDSISTDGSGGHEQHAVHGDHAPPRAVMDLLQVLLGDDGMKRLQPWPPPPSAEPPPQHLPEHQPLLHQLSGRGCAPGVDHQPGPIHAVGHETRPWQGAASRAQCLELEACEDEDDWCDDAFWSSVDQAVANAGTKTEAAGTGATGGGTTLQRSRGGVQGRGTAPAAADSSHATAGDVKSGPGLPMGAECEPRERKQGGVSGRDGQEEEAEDWFEDDAVWEAAEKAVQAAKAGTAQVSRPGTAQSLGLALPAGGGQDAGQRVGLQPMTALERLRLEQGVLRAEQGQCQDHTGAAQRPQRHPGASQSPHHQRQRPSAGAACGWQDGGGGDDSPPRVTAATPCHRPPAIAVRPSSAAAATPRLLQRAPSTPAPEVSAFNSLLTHLGLPAAQPPLVVPPHSSSKAAGSPARPQARPSSKGGLEPPRAHTSALSMQGLDVSYSGTGAGLGTVATATSRLQPLCGAPMQPGLAERHLRSAGLGGENGPVGPAWAEATGGAGDHQHPQAQRHRPPAQDIQTTETLLHDPPSFPLSTQQQHRPLHHSSPCTHSMGANVTGCGLQSLQGPWQSRQPAHGSGHAAYGMGYVNNHAHALLGQRGDEWAAEVEVQVVEEDLPLAWHHQHQRHNGRLYEEQPHVLQQRGGRQGQRGEGFSAAAHPGHPHDEETPGWSIPKSNDRKRLRQHSVTDLHRRVGRPGARVDSSSDSEDYQGVVISIAGQEEEEEEEGGLLEEEHVQVQVCEGEDEEGLGELQEHQVLPSQGREGCAEGGDALPLGMGQDGISQGTTAGLHVTPRPGVTWSNCPGDASASLGAVSQGVAVVPGVVARVRLAVDRPADGPQACDPAGSPSHASALSLGLNATNALSNCSPGAAGAAARQGRGAYAGQAVGSEVMGSGQLAPPGTESRPLVPVVLQTDGDGRYRDGWAGEEGCVAVVDASDSDADMAGWEGSELECGGEWFDLDWEAGCPVVSDEEQELGDMGWEVDGEGGEGGDGERHVTDDGQGGPQDVIQHAEGGADLAVDVEGKHATGGLGGPAAGAAVGAVTAGIVRKRPRTVRELLQARLIQDVLRAHRQSRTDLKTLMSYLASSINEALSLLAHSIEPCAAAPLPPVPETATGLAPVTRQVVLPAAAFGSAVASLQHLYVAAQHNQARLFGADVRVTPHRLFLALLNLAHQHNSSVSEATRNTSKLGTFVGSKDVSMSKMWVSSLAWVRLEQGPLILADDAGTALGDPTTKRQECQEMHPTQTVVTSAAPQPGALGSPGPGQTGARDIFTQWDVQVVLDQASQMTATQNT